MNIFTRFIEFVTRINPFSIEPVVQGHKVEINRRVHRLMYGRDRD